jgi:ankyrin repeat protein
MDSNPVNLLVLDYSSSNLLMKAIGIPTYSNQHVKMLTKEEKVERALVAVKYLLARGMDVNYQNKKGITPLISACHWGEERIVKLLL